MFRTTETITFDKHSIKTFSWCQLKQCYIGIFLKNFELPVITATIFQNEHIIVSHYVYSKWGVGVIP